MGTQLRERRSHDNEIEMKILDAHKRTRMLKAFIATQ